MQLRESLNAGQCQVAFRTVISGQRAGGSVLAGSVPGRGQNRHQRAGGSVLAALTARLTDGVGFPYLLLLVSGGHCQLLVVEGVVGEEVAAAVVVGTTTGCADITE